MSEYHYHQHVAVQRGSTVLYLCVVDFFSGALAISFLPEGIVQTDPVFPPEGASCAEAQ